MERLGRILGRAIIAFGIFWTFSFGMDIWDAQKENSCEKSISQRANIRYCSTERVSFGAPRYVTVVYAYSREEAQKLIAEGRLFTGWYWADILPIALIGYFALFHGMFIGRLITKLIFKLFS